MASRADQRGSITSTSLPGRSEVVHRRHDPSPARRRQKMIRALRPIGAASVSNLCGARLADAARAVALSRP
jgi:hypothetical protein